MPRERFEPLHDPGRFPAGCQAAGSRWSRPKTTRSVPPLRDRLRPSASHADGSHRPRPNTTQPVPPLRDRRRPSSSHAGGSHRSRPNTTRPVPPLHDRRRPPAYRVGGSGRSRRMPRGWFRPPHDRRRPPAYRAGGSGRSCPNTTRAVPPLHCRNRHPHTARAVPAAPPERHATGSAAARSAPAVRVPRGWFRGVGDAMRRSGVGEIRAESHRIVPALHISTRINCKRPPAGARLKPDRTGRSSNQSRTGRSRLSGFAAINLQIQCIDPYL
ncbi:hypothetical protein J2S44_005379 [Catenuloplanes niger]|uniref:Uncharacterized protein n=1 Tax=Catenuloplanes niger TaxID=587534 RepID=A0AAE3ZS94_9ACTN|nr:hypothetical protein [Catenuloplanes niger]